MTRELPSRSAIESAPRSAIVFIHLGLEPVEVLLNTLEIARRSSPKARIVVAMSERHPLFRRFESDGRFETVALERLDPTEAHRQFVQSHRYDEAFRGGFWRHTTERFFVLDELFRHLGLRSAFHAENDNLIFFDADRMAAQLAPLYASLGATFDNDDRCIPGVIYVNDPQVLSKLCDFILGRTLKGAGATAGNDMQLIADFRRAAGRDVIDALPIVTPDYARPLVTRTGQVARDPSLFSRNFDALASVFDAAAIGQYLYGIDPRNTRWRRDTRGFINESCVFDPSAYDYLFLPGPRGAQPYLRAASGLWPINNIHMHSKLALRPEVGPVDRMSAAPRLRRWIDRLPAGLNYRVRRMLRPVKRSLFPPVHAAELAAFKTAAGRRSIAADASSSVALDVIIPAIAKDAQTLPYVVEGLRRNLRHPIGTIFVVASADPALRAMLRRLDCEFVDENEVLPVRRADIDYVWNGLDRSGWMLQQLIKLSGDCVATSPYFLAVDADTVLVRPQVFILDGKPVLLHSDEHYEPYFDVCRKILGAELASGLSCVAHKMLFATDRLRALRTFIESRFAGRWFEAVLAHLRRDEISGFSEYELYGHWVLQRYAAGTVREYAFLESLPRRMLRPLPELERRYAGAYRSTSFHSYIADV